MRRIISVLSVLIATCVLPVSAQGLLDSLDSIVERPIETEFIEGTFKAPRLINGQSIEFLGKNELGALISHRFGAVSQGSYEFFGLTTSRVRLGLDYGLSKKINLGFGVGSFQHLFDGFLKIKLFGQSSGLNSFPLTIVYSATGYYSAERWPDLPVREHLLNSRLSYSHQLLIARKLNKQFSLQVTPGVIHRNLVKKEIDQNNVYSLGMGGSYKITRRLALNAEYYLLLPGQTADDFIDSFSVGLDIETGGHIFQLLFSNSISPQEKVFVPETNQKWIDGDINFGFNIIRVFGLSRHKQD